MSYLLNFVYCLLVLAVSPWLLFSLIFRDKYRQGWAAKLVGQVPQPAGQGTRIWFHAVSVGEANLLQTILPRLEAEHPGLHCVISVTTKTAYELARKKYAPRQVFYCPLDFSWAVNRAMDRLRPDLLVLAELELWPNLIHAAERRGVKVALINGRLSDSSYRGYGRLKWLIGRLLQSFQLIAVQNADYAERFRKLGAPADTVHITGSLKFDGAQTNREDQRVRRLASLAGITPQDVVFLAGSTQDPEEACAIQAFQSLCGDHPQLRLILVPRHPERFAEVAKRLDRSGLPWQRRSQMDRERADPSARVLLVDTVGELGAWWGTAHIAFVGGSLGRRGGQNMIEPAAYGAAVSFGPNTRNFRDVVALMRKHHAAVVVQDADQMRDFVRRCLENRQFMTTLGYHAAQLVRQQLGASETTAQLLSQILERPAGGKSKYSSAA